MTAHQECGIAPHTVNYQLEGNPDAIQRFDIDYDNDGTIDMTTTDVSSLSLQHTYATPGVYPVTAWLTTATGVQQVSLNIVVNDKQQIDDQLQAVWNNLRNALISGNKPLAMKSITPGSSKKYSGLFDALMPYMTEVYNELSVIEPSEVDTDIASYATLRLEGGVIKTYMINFIRGSDGVWRIDSM